MRSLTFSLTSSLGSLCFSSAVVTIMSQLCNVRLHTELAQDPVGKHLQLCTLKHWG
jgi:hypothetical protein